MTGETSGSRLSVSNLILAPAIISLAVTILRLVGELKHWPAPWFVSSAGGGGAIVGIAWLAPVFGIYFALKLQKSGWGMVNAGKTIGFAVLGFFLLLGGAFLAFAPVLHFPGRELFGLLLMAVAGALQFPGWPALGKTLLAYGYAARIPVAIVMYFAIRGNWGTHYDVLPPGYTGPTNFWPKYLQIGLLPQLVFWIGFTMISGALFGAIVTAIVRRRHPASLAAS